ncbi:MAG: thioesterase [Candidatus Aminicenantes bacterium]|nr:thioesterase [Candidatus Aminicenantes bacterium]
MEASVYNETFVMPAGAGDASRTGRLLAMLEEMMETAGRNAAKLGAGMRELHAKGLTWVLARLHVQVQAIPPAGQTIQIATWPAGRHRLFAVREFQVKDSGGREQLRATSAWAMMKKETRRLSRLDPLLPVFSRHPERMVMDDFSPLPPLGQAGSRASYRAQAADIDINDHVNNTVYLDWALRALSERVIPPGPLAMEAAFMGEARLGDEILCRSERARTGDKTIVGQSLQDAASGRELTRLRWTFRASAV